MSIYHACMELKYTIFVVKIKNKELCYQNLECLIKILQRPILANAILCVYFSHNYSFFPFKCFYSIICNINTYKSTVSISI